MTTHNQQNKCYSAALKMLIRREHSQLELSKKLQLKGFDDADIKHSIDLLIEQKYQSDERFSEAFILMRYNQGKGPVIISSELKKRGIENFDLDPRARAYESRALILSCYLYLQTTPQGMGL